MKKTFKFAAFAAMAVSFAFFAACSNDDNGEVKPGNTTGNGGDDEPTEETVTFSSVSDAKYLGNANRNDLGLYTITLNAEGNRLLLEFTSRLSTMEIPVPDDGTYNYSIDDDLNTFSNNSLWTSESNGTETNRKLGAGSFSWTATDKGCKIAGSVEGRDGTKLKFEYEGGVEFLNQTTEPAADAITCLGAYGTYYGKYYIPNAADWYLILYDTVHASAGDPYNYRICLDFTSITPAGSLMPAMGTYRVDSEGTFPEGTFVAGMMDGESGTLWQTPSSGGGSSRVMVKEGSFVIRQNENGKYQVFGTLKDPYGQQISFNYTGNLSFANDAVGKYTSLTEDFDLNVFYANQKCYSVSEDVNLWKMYLYEEKNWNSKGKEGYCLTFDIALPSGAASIPEGTYNVADHVLMPEMGDYIRGYIFAPSSVSAAAYGSWLAKGGDNGLSPWAPVCGGSVTVTKNADGTYTMTFDVTDDNFVPKHIRGSFTGEFPLASGSLDPSGSGGSRAVVSGRTSVDSWSPTLVLQPSARGVK